VTASIPRALVPTSHGRLVRDEGAETALAAQLHLHEFRGFRLSSLGGRWRHRCSSGFGLTGFLPGVLLWLAGLVEATALVLATAMRCSSINGRCGGAAARWASGS
jgi:hypothetical protein